MLRLVLWAFENKALVGWRDRFCHEIRVENHTGKISPISYSEQ